MTEELIQRLRWSDETASREAADELSRLTLQLETTRNQRNSMRMEAEHQGQMRQAAEARVEALRTALQEVDGIFSREGYTTTDHPRPMIYAALSAQKCKTCGGRGEVGGWVGGCASLADGSWETEPCPACFPDEAEEKVEKRELIARQIAGGLGDDFDNAFTSKAEWNEERGEKGGRFRDINEPMQGDYLVAADLVIAVLADACPNNTVTIGQTHAPELLEALKSIRDGLIASREDIGVDDWIEVADAAISKAAS